MDVDGCMYLPELTRHMIYILRLLRWWLDINIGVSTGVPHGSDTIDDCEAATS